MQISQRFSEDFPTVSHLRQPSFSLHFHFDFHKRVASLIVISEMKSPKTVELNVQLCKGKFSNKLQRISQSSS